MCGNCSVIQSKVLLTVKYPSLRPLLTLTLLAMFFLGFATQVSAFGEARITAAQICQIQIVSVNFPTSVTSAENVEVKSQLSVTCKTSTRDIAGTVDIVSEANQTLSNEASIHVGTVPGPQKTVNFTVTNTVKAPTTVGLWKVKLSANLYIDTLIVGSAEKPLQMQVGQLPTQTSTSTSSRTTILSTATTTSTSQQAGGLPIGTLGLVLVVVAVAVVGGLAVFMKRKKSPETKLEAPQERVREEAPKTRPSPPKPDEKSISTGYQDLDSVLEGGLPVGYAVLILSPPCDEKDLLLRRIVESGLKSGRKVFFVSRDLGKVQDLAAQNPNGFFVFSPQVDKTAPPQPNIFAIANVQNLSDINIALGKAIETLGKGETNKIMVLDLLSDVLLENKALTTRKWLSDSILKRKAEGFTILGILNPEVASKQDSHTIIEIFDGIIEIYEKELRERARRFLIVKKMFGRRYSENELMLDKNKLFGP